MTARTDIIEVMEAAYEKSKCGHPDALHDKPMQAALTALEQSMSPELRAAWDKEIDE